MKLICFKNAQSIPDTNNYYFYKGINEVNKYINKEDLFQFVLILD